MADNKRTHIQRIHSSLREFADFPEVKDKIIDGVEVSADHEYYGITIRFQDKTSLNFTLETAVFTFPVLSDWTSGDEEILHKYKAVRSRIQRM